MMWSRSLAVTVLTILPCVSPVAFAQSQVPDAVPETAPSARAMFVEGSVSVGEGGDDGAQSFGYQLLTPPAGAERPEDGWPLIVFLHGAGERGDDNRSQLRHFPERMATAEYRERFPCYVLAVQCPAGERWADVAWSRVPDDDDEAPTSLEREPLPPLRGVELAITEVVVEHPIDLRRITLTGLSMGGFGSWDLAARKPGWFAAVAPICGGGDPRVVEHYEGLPIWAWHDEGDPVVPVEFSRRMVEAAEAAGVEVRYSEVSGHGHASWVPAYDADNLPAWLFEQRRHEPSEELVAARAQQ